VSESSPAEAPAPIFDLVGEAEQNLRRFRAERDGEVELRQAALLRRMGRWRFVIGVAFGMSIGPLASDDAVGWLAGAGIGAIGSGLSRRGVGPAFMGMMAAAIVPALLGCLPGHFTAGWGWRLGSWTLLVAALAALAWAQHLLSELLPKLTAPDGETFRRRVGTAPEALVALDRQAAALAERNHVMKAFRRRLIHLRIVTMGAMAGWFLGMCCGFTVAVDVRFPWLAAAILTVVGGVMAAVITWREWGLLLSMVTYGCASVLVSIVLMMVGQLAISPFLMIWAWCGWVVMGATLGLLTETSDEAIPQRTS
jgi:uncharacterized membrane protein